jgi:hypothetical protein
MIADRTEGPSSLAAWAEFHEQVSEMHQDEREVFHLLWYQGLGQREAADVLGVSLRTVKRIWLSVRRKLSHAAELEFQTAEEWDNCLDARLMIPFFEDDRSAARKLRIFAVACLRRIWHVLGEEDRQCVAAAEQLADGAKSADDLRNMRGGSVFLLLPDPVSAAYIAVNRAFGVMGEIRDRERMAQADLAREVFGNPFCPVAVPPAWLDANDHAVRRLAQTIYAEQSYDLLPFLGDALEDAGCAEQAILQHCRLPQPVEHVRGCWLIDALLAKV